MKRNIGIFIVRLILLIIVFTVANLGFSLKGFVLFFVVMGITFISYVEGRLDS